MPSPKEAGSLPRREAALAADLLAAKLAADRGEELAATELHHGPAMLKPLLAKLQGVPMKEALLQMPLLVQERLQQVGQVGY